MTDLRGPLSRILLALALAGCAGATIEGELPVAAFGHSAEAELAFRPLMRRWIYGTPLERQALEAELAAFCRAYPADALGRLAHVLRAFNALHAGDLGGAERLAREGLLGPAGTVRDLAMLVTGAVERRRGQHLEALDRLVPLLHKLIDPFATALLDEELVQASLGAGRYPQAIRFMEAWLLEADPADKPAVVARLGELLSAVPRARLLEELGRSPSSSAAGARDPRMARLMVRELARLAIAAADTALARVLLDRYGPLLGDRGEEVAKLAADVSRPRVLSKTVGLLLALGSPELLRRSADVVAGMTHGLRIADSDTRLVTRDDGAKPGDIAAPLAALAAQGAAIVVAAVDPAHAEPAARFAQAHALPVVLLTAASAAAHAQSPFVFLAGERPESSVGVLAAKLHDTGSKVVGAVGAPSWPADRGGELGVGLLRPCIPAPAPGELAAERVSALVIVDGAHCDERLLGSLGGPGAMRLAVGLGATVPAKLPAPAFHLAVGVFPIPGGVVERPAQADARLRRWLESGRPPPSWWAALGRDVAVLSKAAVANLADAMAMDEVKARRVEATSALGAARADLWTTEATGFDDRRRLPRTVRVIEGGSSAKP